MMREENKKILIIRCLLQFILHEKGTFGPLLAPPKGLRAPAVGGVGVRGQPRRSGGDPKVI